ncbi:FAD-dependent oxidoreductase [Rugamonas sp. CCM 8940]|uniref:FAD-dependent oxidoreductase n=1 Tax=Rugamonas sp. CCM 8940 TaxID=2765359 RepID=UPI0018F37462|nr:NAD(P)/FAD-dependent oxidoreductase [Rugamonas sp. CCM 8940]MBJ7313340.1 FAD-dependent monooxygenase [Rugamonas sp. CCM 8940]
MTITPLRVAIVGAGLGGLCLAQGLQQHGIAVQVYERDAAPAQRRQGYRLRIDRTGQTALARCLPPALYARFQRGCALEAGGVRTLDTRLAPLQGKWVDDWHDDDDGQADAVPDLRADRQTMRALLLSGLEGKVHFGKALNRYEEGGEHGVILHFDDGGMAEADVLVGADGVHSNVRQQRFPTAAPVDTGDVCCYGKTVLDAATRAKVAAQLQSGTSVIFEQGLALVVDTMRFDAAAPAGGGGATGVGGGGEVGEVSGVSEVSKVGEVGGVATLERTSDYLYWALIGRRASFGIAADDPLRWSEAALRLRIAALVQPWPAPLRALFELAAPDAATLLPVRAAPKLAPWPASRVTLLGDAIHTMSPASGLGANSALFDAAALAQALGEAAVGRLPLLDAIANYEQQMRTHSFTAVQASRQGGKQLFAASEECSI